MACSKAELKSNGDKAFPFCKPSEPQFQASEDLTQWSTWSGRWRVSGQWQKLTHRSSWNCVLWAPRAWHFPTGLLGMWYMKMPRVVLLLRHPVSPNWKENSTFFTRIMSPRGIYLLCLSFSSCVKQVVVLTWVKQFSGQPVPNLGVQKAGIISDFPSS
jgi:hypothetical protein